MKEVFVKPSIKVIELEVESIIADSGAVKGFNSNNDPHARSLDFDQVEDNL